MREMDPKDRKNYSDLKGVTTHFLKKYECFLDPDGNPSNPQLSAVITLNTELIALKPPFKQ